MPHYYHTLNGFFWFQVAYDRLLDTLPTREPSHFVEIGSYQGKSAAYLGVEILHRQLPCMLHCVDSWERPNDQEGPPIRAAFDRNMALLGELLGYQLQVHAMPSILAAEQFENGSVDVVFVDGDHSYEGCSSDIRAWWPKIKVGGWMGGDDYMMMSVARAVCDAFAPRYILCHGWATLPEPRPWPTWMVQKT